MAQTVLATTGSGLDVQFCTAAAGLYCVIKGSMPQIVNAYRLERILKDKPENFADTKWFMIVGMSPTPSLVEALNGRPCAWYCGIDAEMSGGRKLLESPFGKEMVQDGRWKNLVHCAMLSDIMFNGREDAKEWQEARGLSMAVEAYGKTPWLKPDDFLDEWKMILEDEDVLSAMKSAGMSMADWADCSLESQVRSNGGLLDFAGSRWICLNGSGGRLGGKNIDSPAEHGGFLSWQWCPRERTWRLFLEKDGDADIRTAVEACQDFLGKRKPVQFRDRWAVLYVERLPFRLQDVKYFWKF